MIVTKDGIVIETHYYSPKGLKRHRYFIDSLEKAVPDPGTPSGILISELRFRENEASGRLDGNDPSRPAPGSGQAKGSEVVNEFSRQTEPSVSESTEKPKRRLRALKRIETLIYDDTAVKQGQLEDEAYELLNQDGYYDEILPIDCDEEMPETDRTPVKKLILYIALLFVMVGIIVLWIKLVIL